MKIHIFSCRKLSLNIPYHFEIIQWKITVWKIYNFEWFNFMSLKKRVMQVATLKNIIRKADISYPSPCISGKLATAQE